jgi:TatD DNase family protein
MGDTVEVLKQNKEYYKKGIMHCYQGSIETSKELEKLGFYFSFAGPLTYKNSDKLKEVAKNIPIDKILVETDDPYLPPVPFRGKQNHPKYVTYVVNELANLRNLSYEETCEITYDNALKVFDL